MTRAIKVFYKQDNIIYNNANWLELSITNWSDHNKVHKALKFICEYKFNEIKWRGGRQKPRKR